jgi:hypothetical protein
MTRTHHTLPLTLIAAIGCALLFAGCGLAGQLGGHPTRTQVTSAANPGESQGTVPTGAPEAPPSRPASTPTGAISQVAAMYVNWSYRTLAAQQMRLAGITVGEARAAELQAAQQTRRDLTLKRARIYNTGSVLAISPLLGGTPGQYVVVTREETGGDQEYAGLAATYHVTLAAVQRVRAGWSVAQWQPQS